MMAAKEIIIKDSNGLTLATDLLTRIKQIGKSITEEKEKITKPLNEALKSARAFFAPYETQYEEAERVVKGKIVAYNQEQEAARIKAEAKLLDRVANGTLRYETAMAKRMDLPVPERAVKGEMGSFATRRIKKVEITDKSKLPREYLIPDEVKIRADALKGVEIPGVRVYEEDAVTVRI